MADSSSFWRDYIQQATQPVKQDPDTDIDTYNNRNLPMWQRVGLQAPPTDSQAPPLQLAGDVIDRSKQFGIIQQQNRLDNQGGFRPGTPSAPILPLRPPAPQQPNIPITTSQGAPQTPNQAPQTAPNSGVVGASPFANMALTGGGGQPIGGLPTQQPAPNLGSPLQPIAGPIRPQINPQHMQAIAALLQRYRSLGYGPQMAENTTNEQIRKELLEGKQKYESGLPPSNVVLPIQFLENAIKRRT